MKHSKLPWRKVTFPNGGSFIQADKNKPEDPYDIEVFGEDVNPNLYPQEQKDLDIDLTLKFVNNAGNIILLLEDANYSNSSLIQMRNKLLVELKQNKPES